jgi:predicted DsbA family dithiol-disulfide isomerase
MREIIAVSRWFYPADISLHVWLTICALPAAFAVAASWILRGTARRWLAGLTLGLATVGSALALGMIVVELVIYEFGSPAVVAAYAVLVASFIWLARLGSSLRPLKLQLGGAFLLASAAFCYLFPFGYIPPIAELQPEALERLEGPNVLGRASGTLLITEFADFECPACAMQDEAVDKLWGTYPDRIRYTFRHMPLTKLHPNARAAALASQCAAQHGKFWETKRLLFANQNRLGTILSLPVLPTIAAADAGQYSACMESNAAWPEIEKDMQQAKALKLRATPSIVIGNKLIQGMITYPRLALIVRHELAARNLLGPQHASSKPDEGCGSALVTHACEP